MVSIIKQYAADEIEVTWRGRVSRMSLGDVAELWDFFDSAPGVEDVTLRRYGASIRFAPHATTTTELTTYLQKGLIKFSHLLMP
jgi:hypothetical protein